MTNRPDPLAHMFDDDEIESPTLDIRHLSPTQLGQLGRSQLAYVKPVMLNGVRAYAIHAADGEPMAVAGDQALAVAAILQHDMAAALVH